MKHLNYFEPYSEGDKENNLTRAFLVVLRHSPAALLLFYDLVLQSFKNNHNSNKSETGPPSTSGIELGDVKLGTQVGDLEEYDSNNFLSVLLTDDAELDIDKEIVESSRNAIYDGVVAFLPLLTLVIENKPRSSDVWRGQLNPNLEGTEGELLKTPSVVEWSEIIHGLNELTDHPSVGGSEKLLIQDFMEFVNSRFNYLNPYDRWFRCKNEEELLERRIKTILEEIVTDPESIGKQRNWYHYISTGLGELKRIGLGLIETNNKYGLSVTAHFGDTMSQSRKLYENTDFTLEEIRDLEAKGWSYEPDFTVMHISRHIVEFETPKDKEEFYFTYWREHLDLLKQRSRKKLRTLLEEAEKKGLIQIDEEKKEELDEKIYKTGRRDNLNICPGIHLHYDFSPEEANRLDDKGVLEEEIRKRILEVVGATGKKCSFLAQY